jgi:hypothetical protein
MKKAAIVGRPPDPRKKGGPDALADYRRDGVQDPEGPRLKRTIEEIAKKPQSGKAKKTESG